MAIIEKFYNNDRARDIREILTNNFENVSRYIPNNFLILDTTERQNLTEDYKTHFKLVFDKEMERVYRWSEIKRNWEQYLIYAWDEYARTEANENSDKAFIDFFDDVFSKCIDQYDDVFFHTLSDSDVLCRVVPEWGWDESRFIPWDNIDNMNRWNPPGKTYLYLSFDESERKSNDELSVSEYICLEEYRAEKDNKY